MLGGADNPNGELLSYIIGADNTIHSIRYNTNNTVQYAQYIQYGQYIHLLSFSAEIRKKAEADHRFFRR